MLLSCEPLTFGGHIIKMDHLRQLFEALGFSSVETFIASGNVVFDSTSRNTKTLVRNANTVKRLAAKCC
jgi:uncharacterized protein (DUF1697 family)